MSDKPMALTIEDLPNIIEAVRDKLVVDYMDEPSETPAADFGPIRQEMAELGAKVTALESVINRINAASAPVATKPTAKDILDALWADDADGHTLREELYVNIRDKMLDDPVFIRKVTGIATPRTPRTTTPAARNDEDTDAKIGEIINKQLEGLDPKDVTNLATRVKNANILSGVEPDKWNVAISGWIEGGVETLMGAISNLCKRGATAKFDVRAYARLLFLNSAKAEETDGIRAYLNTCEEVKDHLKK